MNNYTIKQLSNNRLQLLDANNLPVPLTTILEITKPARIYAFRAPMGTGKTTFISELCQAMGTKDVANSPTFAIVNVYELPNHEEIYHFDCYRLKNLSEAIDLGAEEYLYSGNYCFIEWPEVIESILPEDTVYLTIRILENGDRQLCIE